MYRQYENPQALEDELRKLKAEKLRLEEMGWLTDELAEIYDERKSELEQRINWAWQDEEYDKCFA